MKLAKLVLIIVLFVLLTTSVAQAQDSASMPSPVSVALDFGSSVTSTSEWLESTGGAMSPCIDVSGVTMQVSALEDIYVLSTANIREQVGIYFMSNSWNDGEGGGCYIPVLGNPAVDQPNTLIHVVLFIMKAKK